MDNTLTRCRQTVEIMKTREIFSHTQRGTAFQQLYTVSSRVHSYIHSLTNIASGILTSWCIVCICVFSVTFLGAFPLYNCDLRLLTSTKVYKVSLDGQLVAVESSWRSQNTSYPDILHTRWTLFSGLKVSLYNAHISISYQVTVHLYNASRGNN